MNRKVVLYPVFILMIAVIFFLILEGGAFLYLRHKGHQNEYASLIEQQGFTPANKKPGELRVFIVGESAARGVPYDLDNSLTGFLRQLVSVTGNDHISIISAAIPGKHSFWQREHARTLLHYKADAVVVYAGNNDSRDFSNVMRDVPFALLDLKLSWNSHFYRLLKRRLFTLQKSINKRLKKKVIDENTNQDDVWHWTDQYLARKKSYLDDPNLGLQRKDAAVQDYRKNLDAMVRSLQKRGVTVYIAELPVVHLSHPTVGDWSRKGLEFKQRISFTSPEEEKQWQNLYDRGKKAFDEQNFDSAEKFFLDAQKINNTYPMLAHLLGEVYFKKQDYQSAREMFVQGKDLQIQSTGGDTLKNEALKWIRDKRQTHWIPLQEALETSSENGMTGLQLFLDHCHPSMLGHKIIASRMMQSFCETGLLNCGGSVDWQHWLEVLVNGEVNPQNLAQEHLLTAFYLFNGTGWHEEPNYADAVVYLEMVRDAMPGDKRPYPFLAAAYWHLDKPAQAAERLDELKRLDAVEYEQTLSEFPFLKNVMVNT